MNRVCYYLAKLGITHNLAPNMQKQKGCFKCLKLIKCYEKKDKVMKLLKFRALLLSRRVPVLTRNCFQNRFSGLQFGIVLVKDYFDTNSFFELSMITQN